MIAYLEGTVKFKGSSYLIIQTSGGVGYKVHTPVDLITGAMIDRPFTLYTYTHIRDDLLENWAVSANLICLLRPAKPKKSSMPLNHSVSRLMKLKKPSNPLKISKAPPPTKSDRH